MAAVCTAVAIKHSTRCVQAGERVRVVFTTLTHECAAQVATFEFLQGMGYNDIVVLAHSVGSFFCMNVGAPRPASPTGGSRASPPPPPRRRFPPVPPGDGATT